MEPLHLASRKSLIYVGLAASILFSGCHHKEAEHKEEEKQPKLVLTNPLKKDTLVTREYVCQIRSCRNIELRAVERGYLQSVFVKEGQVVKENEPMFKILPLVYQAELTSAEAEAQVAKVEYENTKRLTESKVVSDKELAISQAKWEQKKAVVNLAQAHLGFTNINAPFTGLMDRLYLRNGSLVDEGDLLTTLSDNSEMWVYFNVPEAEYLDYMSEEQPEERKKVELLMANGKIFNQPGRVNVIEAEFNNQTGTIPFRADFPNPDRLLRHGETGNIRMKKLVKDALLVPQKCTFEILDHHYVYVVGKDNIIKQERIHVVEEVEDLFIVSSGVTTEDKIIFEGMRQARDGDKAGEYTFEKPEEAFKELKIKAE
ncbi:efflux RND transporter periplasmic adaptor subunit [Prosthecobacter fluviatilis]|uniref:Efflux RND transporter periplasmic adaptor subunit n=1 Tax=Prosthecobacter fluviatilis TaxID=445931 RepID=A0ABW0KJE0_9BACT